MKKGANHPHYGVSQCADIFIQHGKNMRFLDFQVHQPRLDTTQVYEDGFDRACDWGKEQAHRFFSLFVSREKLKALDI
jgi:hypothetical protein